VSRAPRDPCDELLPVFNRLFLKGVTRFVDLIREFPHVLHRSALLKVYYEDGECAIWLGFRGGKPPIPIQLPFPVMPVVEKVDPKNPPYATTVIEAHLDVLLEILDKKLDIRTAYLYDLLEVKSNDGLPVSMHFLLWAAFWDKAIEIL